MNRRGFLKTCVGGAAAAVAGVLPGGLERDGFRRVARIADIKGSTGAHSPAWLVNTIDQSQCDKPSDITIVQYNSRGRPMIWHVDGDCTIEA